MNVQVTHFLAFSLGLQEPRLKLSANSEVIETAAPNSDGSNFGKRWGWEVRSTYVQQITRGSVHILDGLQ